MRRLLLTIPVLIGVATLVFALIHLVPGDPAQAMLGEGAAPEELVKLRHSLGLDQPLLVQYKSFLAGVAHGDLGTSFRYNTPVTAQIREKLPATAKLARRRDGAWRSCSRFRSASSRPCFAARRWTMRPRRSRSPGISMPNFWLGPLLAILFAVRLGWLPVSGTRNVGAPGAAGRHARRGAAAILARMTRASLLEELRELYVLAARARGLSARRAVLATPSATA